jgi:hypothetical protein
VWRAQVLVDLYACCLVFYDYMSNCLLALFFAVLLRTACLILRPNSSLLRVFVVYRFRGGVTSSFFAIVTWRILLLFCSALLIYILLVTTTWFVVFVNFFVDFVALVSACFF